MVYKVFFLCQNFVSSLICTLKSKKIFKNLKEPKNLKTFFLKSSFFQPCPQYICAYMMKAICLHYFIGCYHLNVSSTTIYTSVATTTNCLNELLFSKTKTTLWECCIEIDLTYHTFTYIFPCKLDSVLSVILLNFMLLCYRVVLGLVRQLQPNDSGVIATWITSSRRHHASKLTAAVWWS